LQIGSTSHQAAKQQSSKAHTHRSGKIETILKHVTQLGTHTPSEKNMAIRLSSSPDEHEVSEAVLDAIKFIDTNAIARVLLEDEEFADCFENQRTDGLAEFLGIILTEYINTDAITDEIMKGTGSVRPSMEPDRHLSPIMDSTMLREQILGTRPHRSPSFLHNRTRSDSLTDRAANARVLHTLYPGYAAPARFAEPEVVVTGDLRGETYSAHVVRARIDLAAGVAVTMQVKGYKTHIAAMVALYDESRLKARIRGVREHGRESWELGALGGQVGTLCAWTFGFVRE
jgi:hypothetical protein